MTDWRFKVELDSSDLPGEIGLALWSLEETRNRTLTYVEGISQSTLDYDPPGQRHSIATLLYHIAVFEADWLYVDILGRGYDMERQIPNCPPRIREVLQYPLVLENHVYTPVKDEPLDTLLNRLSTVRAALFAELGQMSLTEFQRVRVSDDVELTPQGVAEHLVQHEAEHRGQIWEARAAAEKADSGA